MKDEAVKIKVLLVDDQPLFVHSLARVISNRADDIEIIGIEENGERALKAVDSLLPDIILMDIKMPVMNGVETTRRISEKYPDIKIMMLTTFDEDEFVIEALQYGAKGYLLKNILPEEVITAIRSLYAGIDQISPAIISRLTSKFHSPTGAEEGGKETAKETPCWFRELTRLERSVLEQMAKGLTNKEIGSSIHLAEQTVKNYLSNIYLKMGVHKRSQAVRMYLDSEIQGKP